MNRAIYRKIDNIYQVKQVVELLKEYHNILIDYNNEAKCMNYLLEAIKALNGTITKISANQYLLTIDKGE